MTEKITNEREKKDDNPKQKTTVWEWSIAALGFILVLIALGTTLYRALAEKETPPMLDITVTSIEPTASGFLVKFDVINSGSQTAANLIVEGELKQGTDSAETSSATLAYAPANSRRKGGLFFAKNPNEYRLELRAKGFEDP